MTLINTGNYQNTMANTQGYTYTVSSNGATGIMAQPIQSIHPGLAIGGTTINLSGLKNQLDEVNSLFSASNIKKYEIVETTEDLLILSCVWYRLRQERNIANAQGIPVMRMPEKLLDEILFARIKQEDRELASIIRDHYSKKIMMLKIKDIKLSKYREDLNNFIHGDGKKFQETICGMVYRLPEFYYHDIKFESMTLGLNKQIDDTERHSSFRLTYIGNMKVDRKAFKRMEYWFKNENDNLVNIILDPSNPLLKVWDRIILEDIHIEGKYYITKRDDFEYYSVKNYSLV